MDSIWVEVFLIGVSILANAFFAGSEIALVSARPSRLSQLRARRVPGADVAEALKKDPDAFLPTIPLVSEEEVKSLVGEGTTQGIFEAAERALVNRVFQFADTPVRLVMVPRPNILGLDIETPPAEVLRRAARLGHTRLPVFRGSIEDARGVVVIKDLFPCAALAQPVNLQRLMHPPLVVPDSAPARAVLRQFQSSRRHLALVVDEYGQVAGLVTTEDLLEEIVGEIRDEGDR